MCDKCSKGFFRAFSLLLVCTMLALSSITVANARFLTPDTWDPILAGVDFNRYAYSHNNPINMSDANGHSYGSSQVGDTPDNINGTESKKETERQKQRQTVAVFKTERNKDRDPEGPWKAWGDEAVRQLPRRGDEVVVEDIRNAIEFQESLRVRTNIRDLVVIGHSSRTAIHFGQDAVPGSNLSHVPGPNNVSPHDIDWSSLASDGTIHLWGCNAGSQPDPIAQHIANTANVSTKAYANYTTLGANGPSVLGGAALAQSYYRNQTLGFNLDDIYRTGPIFGRGGSWGGFQSLGGLTTFEPQN